MNKTQKAAMLLSSLSVYRGILSRTVPKAYYELLCASRAPEQDFLNAWGHFFALMCKRGYTDSIARCLTKAALFDENAFSDAAAAGKENDLPVHVKEAVSRDINAILEASSVTPEQIISDYCCYDSIREIAPSLPRWDTGDPVDEFSDPEKSFERLAAYHRTNGCGMFARYRAFIWRNKSIEPVVYPDKIRLEDMIGYKTQRKAVIDNTEAFLAGSGSNNCLLYGDMGTGKSSTVKAILNHYCSQGLRMVELPKDRLGEFPLLVEKIAAVPHKFILFIDDLSFAENDTSYAQLKAVLEGGLAVRPDNTLIYATSNRRHLVKETFSDREGDELHRNDSIQESLSLSDRFGLNVNFSKPGKDEFVSIVLGLAAQRGLEVDEDILIPQAERWAIMRGGRSPRCATQFISAFEAELSGKKE